MEENNIQNADEKSFEELLNENLAECHEAARVIERTELALAAIEVCVEVNECDVLSAIDVDDATERSIGNGMITANGEGDCAGFSDLARDPPNLFQRLRVAVRIHSRIAVVHDIDVLERVDECLVLDPAQREVARTVTAIVTRITNLRRCPDVSGRVRERAGRRTEDRDVDFFGTKIVRRQRDGTLEKSLDTDRFELQLVALDIHRARFAIRELGVVEFLSPDAGGFIHADLGSQWVIRVDMWPSRGLFLWRLFDVRFVDLRVCTRRKQKSNASHYQWTQQSARSHKVTP